MKNKIKLSGFLFCFFLLISESEYSQTENSEILPSQDSMALIANYSLFSEYYKNREYQSALQYGWLVLEQNPQKFNRWLFFKMEDALWRLHDSSNISKNEINAIEDTIDYFYKLAVNYYPAAKGYFEVRKAFVDEIWINAPADTVIYEYEQAIKIDSTLSFYYFNRLGLLYKNNASDKNDYKNKAIDLYSYLSTQEPNNSEWPAQLESLVENVKELAEIKKKSWELDKENTSKAWEYAAAALKSGMSKEAIEALEFLIIKSPDNVNYLTQLAAAYHKVGRLDNAESTYKKLIKLMPENRDFYLNIGTIYKDKGRLAQARTEYLKANEVSKGWGLSIFYEGLLYEQAARNCEFNFDTKLVYLLAVETYKKAINLDPMLEQAKQRISALSGSLPTKEDFFFRGYKSGQILPVTGSCFGWIGKSISVP